MQTTISFKSQLGERFAAGYRFRSNKGTEKEELHYSLAGLWVLLQIFFLQTALASARESEYRAAAISWIAVGVLAAAGVLVWFLQGRSNTPAT